MTGPMMTVKLEGWMNDYQNGRLNGMIDKWLIQSVDDWVDEGL